MIRARFPVALAARQRGVGIMETMIGILIGLIVVVVVYNMLAVAENYKRTAIGTADAQITGLMSQFMVSQDIASGGNGIASGYNDLITCNLDEAGGAPTKETSLKPIPLLITAGTGDNPDSFIARHGGSPHVIWPVPFRPVDAVTDTVVAGADIQVQSPNGFLTPAKASLPTSTNPYWAVAVANDGSNKCGLIGIGAAAPATTPLMDDSGEVKLTQVAPKTTIAYKGVPQNAAGTGAMLLILGPQNGPGAATRVRYDLNNGQLRSTNCMFADGCSNAGAVPVPIAQNIVWMKAQYGIDTNAVLPNGTLPGRFECWARPTNDGDCAIAGSGGWAPDEILKAGQGGVPANLLNRIVAVRIAFVVRADEPDFRDPALYRTTATTIDGVTGTRADQYIFNCPANTDADCPNRLQIPAGATGSGKVMEDGWRYRVYEMVVPLRNALFAGTTPS
ncbi:MAG: PilW family protein [Burkholderiales bacterium]|nr:PilW family protein [Burkholderiales bacterium]